MTNLTPWQYIMARRRFTLLPKLPVEIQDEILRLTLEPRIVEVRPKKDNFYGFYSTAPIPVVLTVCKDWRRAVLPLYPRLLSQVLGTPGIRFNAKIDTLYLDWKLQGRLMTFLLSINLKLAKKIQFLAIDQYIRWSRHSTTLDYDWDAAVDIDHPLTIADLQTLLFRHCCHMDVNHLLCRIDSRELQRLCYMIRLMKKLKELTFVHDDIIWDEELLKESGVSPQQDELAGLTLFKAEEVYDLFPKPVDTIISDYRQSIEYYNEDMPIKNLHDELKSKFDSPKFEMLVRYGWRFPDSLSLPSRQPRLTESE
ncbi:hypothetical protein BGAL_0008g00190 [Botrytis galanthina]|uniref:2EXR domain-containing protein n=1 Tax=Botrytis galanthina TaxID=278940 RepID=A0A4S8RFQ2_9HELO|nr:hypothetical protein BGAL_0008g00190 [Botrytis galanthina]